jgi:hypothetical protein
MATRAKPEKSWRQLAAEVAQEDDPQKLAVLTSQLLGALEEEKRQAEVHFQLASKPPAKLRSA